MAFKEFIFNETLAGFNEDIVISNKPNALLKAVNCDFEKQPGTARRRKGYERLGNQMVAGNNVLGLYDFVKSNGTRVNLSVINDSVEITNASYSDPTVTLTVGSNHGIVAGDEIVVSGLAPSGYNGTFTVTSVTSTEVKYSAAGLGALSDTTGAMGFSQIMYLNSGTWTVAKRGLTKDAIASFATLVDYCFFTNGHQLLTSSDGITWGTENLINTHIVSAVSYSNTVAKLTITGSHSVVAGDTITLSTLTKTISVTDVSYSDPTVTLTVASGHGVLPGNTIVVAKLDSDYNGTYTVTSVTATTIVYSKAGLSAPADKAGTVKISGDNRYINITNVSYSTPNITLTVPTGHGIVAGNEITVSDLDASYNGTYTVTSVTTTTIVVQKVGLSAPSDTTGKFLPRQYAGTRTVSEVTSTTISFVDPLLAAPVCNSGTFTINYTLPAKEILEYQNVLFLIGLKGYPSDFMYSNIPFKNSNNVYALSWSRSNNATVETGNGEELAGSIPYRGALYFLKNSSTTRTAYPIATNGLKPLSKNHGTADLRSKIVIGGQLIYFNQGDRDAKRGFYSYDSISDSEPQIISEPMQPYIDGMGATVTPIIGSINDLMIAYIGPVVNAEADINIPYCYLVFNTKTLRWLGAWSLKHPATYMTQIVNNGVSYLTMGDNNGKAWLLNKGNYDGVEDTTALDIEMAMTSNNYDISRSSDGIRLTFKKREVMNLWVVGDSLEGVNFQYRFDAITSSQEGWIDALPFISPVSQVPIKKQPVFLFQFRTSHSGSGNSNPIIRKVVIEFGD